MVTEKIEILPVSLLDQNRQRITALKEIARPLKLEFGWHYLLDLTWIISHLEKYLGDLTDRRILDAGAGVGVLQWYLASRGAEVASVDRLSRAALPLRFRSRFDVQGLRPTDLLDPVQTLRENLSRRENGALFRRWWGKTIYLAREISALIPNTRAPGRICIYNQDLADLSNIPDETMDAIVAVSSLEHNTPEGLVKVVDELMRVLKPRGILLATLVAADERDTWHEASSAWCYTDESLRRIFKLPEAAPSNYERYDELFQALVDCAELRDDLAKFYFQSDKSGMPWGKWDPQYQPVGVCKIKAPQPA